MSTQSSAPNDPIPESDKPFILLMVGTGAVIAIGSYAIVVGKWDSAKELISMLIPLVSMGWGFYFKSKSS